MMRGPRCGSEEGGGGLPAAMPPKPPRPLRRPQVWIRKRSSLKSLGDASSSVAKRNWLLLRHYWHRVGGAALNW